MSQNQGIPPRTAGALELKIRESLVTRAQGAGNGGCLDELRPRTDHGEHTHQAASSVGGKGRPQVGQRGPHCRVSNWASGRRGGATGPQPEQR